MQQAGWKDDWLLIVFSIPLVMCFIPNCVQYVEDGFLALTKTPDWYLYAILLMVGSTFGSKKILNYMATKKGA